MKMELGEQQGRAEQSVGSEGALGKQSSGRAGSPCPQLPAPTKGPSETPALLHLSGDKPQSAGTGKRGGSDGSQPAGQGWRHRAPAEPALPWVSSGGAARDGGWPQPCTPAPAPALVPLRCHSHGHRWTGH